MGVGSGVEFDGIPVVRLLISHEPARGQPESAIQRRIVPEQQRLHNGHHGEDDDVFTPHARFRRVRAFYRDF